MVDMIVAQSTASVNSLILILLLFSEFETANCSAEMSPYGKQGDIDDERAVQIEDD